MPCQPPCLPLQNFCATLSPSIIDRHALLHCFSVVLLQKCYKTMPKYDKERIKARYDLRQVVERDLGAPARSGPRDNRYRCPFHNEQKGYSLAVYADHWHCYGKCSTGGDVIEWTMRFHNLSFAEACQRLDPDAVLPNAPAKHVDLAQRPAPAPVPHPTEPPPEDWQAAARAIVAEARATLWREEGRKARLYLTQTRGIELETIAAADLGYIPGAPTEWRTMHGLNVPCGILIPWEADGVLWGIKVRRAAGDQRYHQVAGGALKGGLYWADHVAPGLPMIVTEGEFDALVLWQVAHDLVRPVSIGSAGNARIDPRWWMLLNAAPRVLVRMDADAAGDQAAAHIHGLLSTARRVDVPQGKDPNEFLLAAGAQAVRDWLAPLLQ